MGSFIYRHPNLYKIMLKLIHRRSLYERYKYISNVIGKNKDVFELGCGTAFLQPFLHRSCNYTGWDLNKRFVDHCQKRGINALKKDIFNFNEYPENDVTVVCDVLHHIFPKDRILIENAMKNTKKLIVIEPYHNKPKIPNFILKKLIFLDDDGINNDKSRYMWDLSKCRELIDHFKQSVSIRTSKMGLDMIAIFDQGVSS